MSVSVADIHNTFLKELCKKNMLTYRYQHLSRLHGFSSETPVPGMNKACISFAEWI